MIPFAIIMVIVALGMTIVWYVPLLRKGHAHPVPATFILAAAAFWIASASHLAVPGIPLMEKLAGNITLFVSTAQCTVILSVIAYTYVKTGEWKVSFDRMQKFCFVIMATSLLYWFLNKDQSMVTYWTVQVLMVVAYSATVIKIFSRKQAFDSIGMWAMITSASIFGFIPAIVTGSQYGIGNSIRSMISSGLTAALFFYYDRRNGGIRWQAEKQSLIDFYKPMFNKPVKTG